MWQEAMAVPVVSARVKSIGNMSALYSAVWQEAVGVPVVSARMALVGDGGAGQAGGSSGGGCGNAFAQSVGRRCGGRKVS